MEQTCGSDNRGSDRLTHFGVSTLPNHFGLQAIQMAQIRHFEVSRLSEGVWKQ